jgi:hypothetical protein
MKSGEDQGTAAMIGKPMSDVEIVARELHDQYSLEFYSPPWEELSPFGAASFLDSAKGILNALTANGRAKIVLCDPTPDMQEADADQRYKKEIAAKKLEWAGLRFFEVLKQIANGHNDHRSLAVEAIREFEKWKLT